MKKLFTLKQNYRSDWYRIALVSVFLILTGIYSININGQTKAAPGAAAKSVDINEKPDKLNSSNIIDSNISDIIKSNEAESKPDDQAVNTLPEIRQPSNSSVQDQKENTLTVITLSDSEIGKMKAGINEFREEAPEILPDNLNVISIPDRDISNFTELETDNQVINALPKIPEAAKSIRQEEVKSTLPEMPFIISDTEKVKSETDALQDNNPEIMKTEDQQKASTDDENMPPKSELAGENLTIYQPAGWDSKIIVSTVTGTHTSASVIYPTDNLYVDWSIINNGTANIATTFYSRLFVDGVQKGNWYTSSLNAGYYTWIYDFSVGTLSPGNHTLRIVTDATGVITETNEADNEFTRTIFISGPNLTPYKPGTWDDKIVVSSGTGTSVSTPPFFNTQTLYVDWAVTNNGALATTTTFHSKLYVDGVEKGTWYTSGLAAGYWAFLGDHNIGILTAGTHTIKIVNDVNGVIAETSETDNEYTRTITVYPNVNLIPYQPGGWDDKLVLSTVTGTNTSAALFNYGQPIYVDWAALNNGGDDISATFYIRLYIDGVSRGAWTKGGLVHNTYTWAVDFNAGILTAGSHTFKVIVDSDGHVTETNEADNEYSRTINIIGPNLTTYLPSGWDNKIVVSTGTGTHTSTTPIFNTQNIYIDWAVINNGTAGITTAFTTILYIDGVIKNTWTVGALGIGSYVYASDYNVGVLSAGTHTLRVRTDAGGVITESNEADNEYTRTITVYPNVNLTPYQPGGWDDKIVLSTVTGTNSSAEVINSAQPIYVDWAALNNGTGDISATFYIRLFVDGVSKGAWTKAGLVHNTYTWAVDFNAGTLPAGSHTFKIIVDSDGHVTETNEGDNEYSRTITIVPAPSLIVSPTSMTIGPASGSTGTFNITSNTTWSITDDASWLSVSPVSGANNAAITVTATSANTGASPRTATVTIAGAGVTPDKTVTVTQSTSTAIKTLGNTTVYGSTSTTANRRAQIITFPEAGTIQSISIYHNGGTGRVLLAVYDDVSGSPGGRLGVTPETVINASAGWQTISLIIPVSVTSGQNVWLSWVFEVNPGVRYIAGPPARAQSEATWPGGMPNPFGASTFADYKYSAYCSYIAGPPPATKTLGNTTVYGSTSTTANRRAQIITFPEAGTIQSISIYHNGGTGSLLLGVYADASGAPGARLGVAPATVINASAGWQTISLTSPVSVISGQNVWLSWVFENNPGIRYIAGTPARAESPQVWAGGMPDPFGTASFANYKYSLYCTYKTGTGPVTKTLGNTEVYSLSSTTANRRAQTVTFPEAGTVQSISIYHNGGTGSVLLGVYADAGGAPGARLGVTPSTILNASAGWQTISLTTPVSVTSGQNVWLSWVFQNNPGIRYIAGTPARAESPQVWAGGMPDPFGTASFGNYKYSLYCTYTTGTGPVTKTLGNTEVYSLSSTTANRRAQTVTFPEAGTVESISIYHNGGTGQVLLGLYTDASGAPGARLGVTASTVINAAAGWQTIPLTSTYSVASGQQVWLSWVFENNPGIRYVAGTPARAESPNLWAGGMPDPFGTASFANYKYSLYCTYTTGSADEIKDMDDVKSVNTPTDINSVYMDKEDVSIYPNPTDGDITVTWKNRYSHRLDITIYNILGKAIREVQTDPDVNEIRLDLNGTSRGIYLFEMKDKKNDLILNRSRIIKK